MTRRLPDRPPQGAAQPPARLQIRTIVTSWRWCADAAAVADAIATRGPVVIGIAWHSSMDDDSVPVMNVDLKSQIRGGHCVCLRGYDANTGRFRLRNSWGTSWADKGEIDLRFADLDALLSEGGEAATARYR